MARSAWGAKLASIMALNDRTPALYADSDLWYFPRAQELREVCAGDTPLFMQDIAPFLDERLLSGDSIGDQTDVPLNAGFLFVPNPLDWTESSARLAALSGEPIGDTEQAAAHLTFRLAGGRPFPLDALRRKSPQNEAATRSARGRSLRPPLHTPSARPVLAGGCSVRGSAPTRARAVTRDGLTRDASRASRVRAARRRRCGKCRPTRSGAARLWLGGRTRGTESIGGRRPSCCRRSGRPPARLDAGVREPDPGCAVRATAPPLPAQR